MNLPPSRDTLRLICTEHHFIPPWLQSPRVCTCKPCSSFGPLLPPHSLAMPIPLLGAQVAHTHSGLISENFMLCIWQGMHNAPPPHTHTATLSGLLIYRKTSRDLDNPLIPLASAFIFQSVVLSCQEQWLNQCFTIWDWLSKAGFLRACLPTLHSQSSLGKQLCLHWREHSNETIKCFRSGHFRETRVISIRA